MRVSLQIDGDASGAQKAASDASAAIEGLSKQAGAASKVVEDGFKQASGSVDNLAKASQAAGAANDNSANAALGLAGKLAQVAGAAAGADSALAKGANGAVSFAKGIGEFAKAAGAYNAIGIAIGLATTAVSTFHDISNRGSKSAADQLTEQARLVNVVRDAYKDAKSKAGEFYEQSAAVTKLQALQNSADLSKTLQGQVGQFISGATTFGNVGDFISQTKQIKSDLAPFEDALFKLNDGFKKGAPDVKEFVDEVARLALIDPALQKAAGELIKKLDEASATARGIEKNRAVVAQIDGTATKAQKSQLGLAPDNSADQFERFAKGIERQSAAQEAEARTAGLSAGAAAKLRTEFVLTEAAQQAGIKVAGEYADKIAAIAARSGEAAQKLAQARLQTDTAFNTAQLGRTAIDASVADQLRGAYGNNADQNSAIANNIRFNETLRDIKSTSLDLASGGFREFRTEVQSGTNALEAMGKVGVNALDKIITKLGDKALDTLISGALGSFLGGGGINANGSITGAFGPTSIGGAPLVGMDSGGWTGPGGKYDVAGYVHRDEFVFNKERTNQLGVGFLDRLHKGYADGGLVGGGPAPWGSLASPQSGNGGATGTPQAIKVDVGVSIDGDGNLTARVKSISTQAASDIVSGFVSSPDFVAHVADASRQAQVGRQL
jgi:lambda family phage tail tape measure protein